MTEQKAYRFSSFRLDPATWRLRKNNEFRPLRPKTFAILRYLLDNAGRLVTKEDLYAAVWPGLKVEQSALRVCMNELRQVLDDSPRRPRFVETVHRRGYRFIAPVDLTDNEDDEPARLVRAQPIIVGREAEMSRLLESWEIALSGTPQVVFLVGEPGVGKTTLLESFLAAPLVAGFARVGKGHCADQYGKSEAYLPVFDAITQICSGPKGRDARKAFFRDAPGWAAHMPGLRGADSPAADGASHASPGLMLAEMAATIGRIAPTRPVMLVFEDLHLADQATTELIAYLARRRDPVRLMIVGTFRNTQPRRDPARLTAVTRDLQARKQCQVIRLHGLDESAVADYLNRRINRPLSQKLLSQVCRRTGGNPLFMTAIVDHMEALGARAWPDDLRELGVPDTVHAMIEQQIEDLPEDDQKFLKTASIAAAVGFEFSSAALAAALENDPSASQQDRIEERCEALTRRLNFLHATGISRWPDGTIAATYAFGHALYQEVLYGMNSAGYRARTHLRIANRLQNAFAAKSTAVASELSAHFERGGEFRRAAECLNDAIDTMISRGASLLALRETERALELLHRAPDENNRVHAELRLEATRGIGLVTGGGSSERIDACVQRMSVLAQEAGNWAVHMLLVQGITRFNDAPSERRAALAMIKTGLRQAESAPKESAEAGLVPLQSIGHTALSIACNQRGEFRDAIAHAHKAIETYDPAYQPPSFDSRVFSIAEEAVAHWSLGFPDQARRRALEAIDAAEKISRAPVLVYALARGATVFGLCQDFAKANAIVDRLITFAADKDLSTMRAWGYFLRGALRSWMGAPDEACRIMRPALAELDSPAERRRAGDTTTARLTFCQAEFLAGLLRPHEAIARLTRIVEDALQMASEGSLADAYRLMGVITLSQEPGNSGTAREAEKLFHKAIQTAHEQGSQSLELRVALDLAALFHRQGKTVEAKQLLSGIYQRFTEGHDTGDLKAAANLLARL